MTNSFPPMRDEAAIPYFARTIQSDGTVCYFFGNTTIRAAEIQTAEGIHLVPISGVQVACGEWLNLDEDQVCRYCELLTRHLNSGEPNDMNADTSSVIQTVRVHTLLKKGEDDTALSLSIAKEKQ